MIFQHDFFRAKRGFLYLSLADVRIHLPVITFSAHPSDSKDQSWQARRSYQKGARVRLREEPESEDRETGDSNIPISGRMGLSRNPPQTNGHITDFIRWSLRYYPASGRKKLGSEGVHEATESNLQQRGPEV